MPARKRGAAKAQEKTAQEPARPPRPYNRRAPPPSDQPTAPPPPADQVVPPDGRLDIIIWMCQTGYGPGNAARHFGRGLTAKKCDGYIKWAMRHNMWPPPGVVMAPRRSRVESTKFSARLRAAQAKLAEEEGPDPRKRPGPVAVERVEPTVRARLVKIRDQALDRLEELSRSGSGADAFRSFASGLRILTDKFEGLEALDATTNTRESSRARLARLRAVADGGDSGADGAE